MLKEEKGVYRNGAMVPFCQCFETVLGNSVRSACQVAVMINLVPELTFSQGRRKQRAQTYK